jgi:hypothetical protein
VAKYNSLLMAALNVPNPILAYLEVTMYPSSSSIRVCPSYYSRLVSFVNELSACLLLASLQRRLELWMACEQLQLDPSPNDVAAEAAYRLVRSGLRNHWTNACSVSAVAAAADAASAKAAAAAAAKKKRKAKAMAADSKPMAADSKPSTDKKQKKST